MIRGFSTVASLSSWITESDTKPVRIKEELLYRIRISSGDMTEGTIEEM